MTWMEMQMVQISNCIKVSLGPLALASLEPFKLCTEQQITLLGSVSKLQGKSYMYQYKLREHNNCEVVIPNLKKREYLLYSIFPWRILLNYLPCNFEKAPAVVLQISLTFNTEDNSFHEVLLWTCPAPDYQTTQEYIISMFSKKEATSGFSSNSIKTCTL